MPTIAGNRRRLPCDVRPPAASVLGRSHPLVETIETLAEARRQALAAGLALLASLPPAAAGLAWAETAALTAAAMTCVLVAATFSLGCRRRRCALELILEGRERLPVAAVEEERRRLLDANSLITLAASFETLADDATSPGCWPAMSIFRRETVSTVADDLRDVGSLLRSGPGTARGVALARSLLTDGVQSPLHRGNEGALHQELHRIRFLLTSTRS